MELGVTMQRLSLPIGFINRLSGYFINKRSIHIKQAMVELQPLATKKTTKNRDLARQQNTRMKWYKEDFLTVLGGGIPYLIDFIDVSSQIAI
jgi:uncharacterized protein (DUF2384 family)